MIDDNQLLKYYEFGLLDEFEKTISRPLPQDVLIIKAYKLGRKDAVVRILNPPTDDEIIDLIRNK